jgi:hypothetical protein
MVACNLTLLEIERCIGEDVLNVSEPAPAVLFISPIRGPYHLF